MRHMVAGRLDESAARFREAYHGVLGFGGEDWWLHNRGHFDFQMMRELSRRLAFLYVNSVGMRFPSLGEGEVFLVRVRRKWASMRRGIADVRPNLSVFSAVMVPGTVGRMLSRRLLIAQTRYAMRRMGFERPLIRVAVRPRGEPAPRRAGSPLLLGGKRRVREA